MIKNISDPQTFHIPEYNLKSLVKSVTRIINQARRSEISDSDAVDEIVRAYEDHSTI